MCMWRTAINTCSLPNSDNFGQECRGVNCENCILLIYLAVEKEILKEKMRQRIKRWLDEKEQLCKIPKD